MSETAVANQLAESISQNIKVEVILFFVIFITIALLFFFILISVSKRLNKRKKKGGSYMKKQKNKGLLRGFFKFTKEKILLAILLALLFPVMSLFERLGLFLLNTIFFLPLVISSFFQVESGNGFDVTYTPSFSSIVVGLGIYLLEVYIISSLIILIYKGVRKNAIIYHERKNERGETIMKFYKSWWFWLIVILCLLLFLAYYYISPWDSPLYIR